MSSPWNSALISGALIAVINILFSGFQYGFSTLPVWFYLAQLLLIPAMLFPMRLFPQAAMTPNFFQRALLFALGWAVPYAIYKFSGDALNPSFNPLSSLSTYSWLLIVLSVVFAVIRAPKQK